jgi:multiple sugar transport system permease protein
MAEPRSSYSARRRRDHRDFGALAGPAIIVFSTLLLAPVGFMFAISLLDWPGLTKPWAFVGVANYVALASDSFFRTAIVNTSIHLVFGIGIIIPVAFVLGYFLAQRPRGHGVFRTIFFTPTMLAVSALAMVFVGVYVQGGILNSILRSLGLESLTRSWLGDTTTALAAIIAVDVWAGVGFYAVLFYASLSGIPDEIYEAARIDGAGRWTSLLRIAVPMSRDFIGIMTMLLFLWILLGAAQNVLLLTKGGPGQVTMTLGYFLYTQAFRAGNIGYSQAIGVFIFAVGLCGMAAIRFVSRRNAT